MTIYAYTLQFDLPFLVLNFRRVLNVLYFLLDISPAPEEFTPTCLWIWNRQSVPKRRHKKIQTPGNYPEESIIHLYVTQVSADICRCMQVTLLRTPAPTTQLYCHPGRGAIRVRGGEGGVACSGRCYNHCQLWRQTLDDCGVGCDVVRSGKYFLNNLS